MMYAVGQPFIKGKTDWSEHVGFEYNAIGGELRIMYNNLRDVEIEDIRSGDLSMGFFEEDNIQWFLFNFSKSFQFECSFTNHLVHEDNRGSTEYIEGDHGLLTVFLVEASTGILKAMRSCTFSKEFTKTYLNSIERSMNTPFNQQEHTKKVSLTYFKYKTFPDMWKRCTVFCNAGD